MVTQLQWRYNIATNSFDISINYWISHCINFDRIKSMKYLFFFRNYLRRSRHLESEGRVPCSTLLLSSSPNNMKSFDQQCFDPTVNYTITPRDILSFAWQISKGMAYLADIKVKFELSLDQKYIWLVYAWIKIIIKIIEYKITKKIAWLQKMTILICEIDIFYSWCIEIWLQEMYYLQREKFVKYRTSAWRAMFTKTMHI